MLTTTDDYDVQTLSQFVELFPDTPLARIVSTYFAMIGEPLNVDPEEEAKAQAPDDDYVGTILVR